jgi:hypothetical protein
LANDPWRRLARDLAGRATRKPPFGEETAMNQWYVQFADKIYGPMTLDDLRRRVAAGQIPPESLARDGPTGQWTAVSRLPALQTPMWPDPMQPMPKTSREQDTAARRGPLPLRPCADCGEYVSQQATACPRCGRSMTLTTIEVPYRGEHPIAVLIFFAMLAVVFVLTTPVLVYFGADYLSASAGVSEAAQGRIAFLAAAAYTISMVVCSVLGRAVGAARMAFYTGMLLGLFFGPMGVLVAFAVDKRTQCPNCFSRLDGLARQCPFCRVMLRWEQRPRWY